MEYKAVAEQVATLLKDNPKWIVDFIEYAMLILKNEETVKRNKKLFHEFSPLFLYMNVTNAKSNCVFGLRYAGQQVADMKVSNGEVLISTKEYDTVNKRDFNCDIQLHNAIWNSAEVAKFRKHFSNDLQRNKVGKSNEEHRVESMLLTEFSKKKSTDKKLVGIQPVKLFGDISRFQMKTPLSASKNEIKYSGVHGGGIDILCRMGKGAKTNLCVVEVKDENVSTEPPQKAIKQAIGYAVFLRELLRSDSGSDWYNIFGFKRSVPEKLEIIASVAMPYSEKFISDFDNVEIDLDGNDKIILHFMFFEMDNQEVIKIRCSYEN